MTQPPQDGQDPQGGQPSPGQGGAGSQSGVNPPQRRPQPGYPSQPGPPQPGYPPQGFPQQQGYPGQPYAGGPGPQGFSGPPPNGPQPYAPGPYARGPYGPVPGQPGQGQPGQGPKKKRTGLFVLIGVGALALLLVVVALAVNLGGKTEGAGGGTTGSGGGASNAPAAASASDAVKGYLEAIAKGDPAAAVSYAASPGVDTTLMTPEVLAASAKLGPMTDIQVTPVTDKDATSVPVTYSLGKTPVSTSFDVVKTADDAWKLVAVAADVDVSAVKDDGIPMLINGVAVKKASLSLLPGAYRFTSGQPNFDYGKQSTLLVESPADYPDITQLQPGVSSKGRSAALSALKKSWSKCLDSEDAKPGGCPNRWNNGSYKFKNGTVKWSRKGSDPVKKPRANVYSTYVIYSVKVDLTLKGTCSSGGRTGTCTGTLTGGTALARADVSGNKVKISWQV